MPDPFDNARRSLEDVPAPDLWAEAERRSMTDDGLALPGGGAPGGRRWLLAAAAVAAIAVVGAAALAWPDDDGARLDTTPATEPSTTATPSPTAPSVVVGVEGADEVHEDGACWVGLSGDPIVLEPGPADPPLYPASDPQPGQLVLHDKTGGLLVELSLPGAVVIDLLGEQVEEIELARGPALLWITEEFAQVRWFPNDAADPQCGSFTVTVAGGTPAEERETAVDYADRIMLDSDDG